MLNRLNKFRFLSGEKVSFVFCKATLRIEADAVRSADQFEANKGGKSFAWIYGSEQMDSDPLVPKAIWGFNGSEHLNEIGLFKVLMDLWKSNVINLTKQK